MQENYGNLVSQALIKEWINDPPNAPGRLTSSPWPDRIEILSTEKLSEDTYEVKGEIIEITSVEKMSGGVAAKRPITLALKKIENSWLIDDVTLGAYEETSSTVHEQTTASAETTASDETQSIEQLSEQPDKAKYDEYFTEFYLAKLPLGTELSASNIPVKTAVFITSKDQFASVMSVKKDILPGVCLVLFMTQWPKKILSQRQLFPWL
ncbi:MAG: hypothetical protein ACYDIA_23660 [Candidatus Humimicrobiaceae bacterium]